MVYMSAYGIGQAVVADVCHNKKIASAHRFSETSLCLSGSETRAGAFDKIRVLRIILEIYIVAVLRIYFFAEIHKIAIHFFCKIPASFQRGNLQRCYRKDIFKLIIF